MDYKTAKELIEDFLEFAQDFPNEESMHEFLEEKHPCDHEDTYTPACSSCNGAGCHWCKNQGDADYKICEICGKEIEL